MRLSPASRRPLPPVLSPSFPPLAGVRPAPPSESSPRLLLLPRLCPSQAGGSPREGFECPVPSQRAGLDPDFVQEQRGRPARLVVTVWPMVKQRESEGREHVVSPEQRMYRREITGVRTWGSSVWFRLIQRALRKHGWFLSDSKLFKAYCKSPSEMLGRYGGWDQE